MPRPDITACEIGRFVAERYPGASRPRLTGTGQHSVAAAFEHAGRDLIVRVAASDAGYRRDRFIGQITAGTVPVPAVLDVGQFDATLSYAISVRAGGQHHDGRFDTPIVLQALDDVHRVDISRTVGWGPFDGAGCGLHPDWPAAVAAQAPADQDLACAEPWWDAQLADALRAALLDVDVPTAPRCLVHGDFGWANLLLDAGEVTAVLDWDFAFYGDPLYDVALIDFWACDSSGEFISRWARRHDLTVDEIRARYRVCALMVACGMLGYIAKTGDRSPWERELAAAARCLLR